MPAPLPIQVCDHYMVKRAKGLSQEAAAAAAGISIRTAQKNLHGPWLSSHPGELPPEVLPEPYVTLSRHTAPIIHSPQHRHLASGQTALIVAAGSV
jgi:hypothetical protein